MKLRYERKYLVKNELLHELRKAVVPFVRPDQYADRGDRHPQYTVRSIYLDNPAKLAVYDKIEGIKVRKKLRVRGYNNQTKDSIVFLEIKRKISDQISKNRARLKYSDLEKLLDYGDIDAWLVDKDDRSKDDASRFLYNMKRYHMVPVNLVVYDREPYHGFFDSDVRITFDKNVRSRLVSGFDGLFEDTSYEYPWEAHFVLEIKYYHAPMPSWAKAIVREFELKNAALSKYVEGYLCHSLKHKDV